MQQIPSQAVQQQQEQSEMSSLSNENKYVFTSADEQLLEKNAWIDVKEKAERLVIAYELKFMPAIRKTIDLLNLMLKAKLEAFTPQQITFFIDEILFTVVKNVIEHREYQTEDNYLISEEILLKSLELISQSIHLDIPKLAEILAFIFNTQRSFYSKNILLKGPPQHDYPLGYEFVRNEERKKWEEELQIGDCIDCIKLEFFYNRQSWTRGTIQNIVNSMITVKIDASGDENKQFAKSSYMIAPLGEKSTDYEWRESLNVNDEIDIEDSFNVWQNATVLDSKVTLNKEGITEKQIYVGMRIYREDGDKFDAERQQKYFGWSESFDLWISPHSARIQKFNRLAKKLYKPQSSKAYIHRVDDANDIIFEQENQISKIYAIQRGDKNNNLIKFINHFGSLGGFQTIVQRFQNYTNQCPIEILQYYLESFHNVQSYFFLNFAREIIPPLWESVQYLLMNPTEQYLRTYDKEKLESIIVYLEVLLFRIFSHLEQIKLTENLSLGLALKCYQTGVLKQRIAGLKLICEIIKYVKSNSYKSVDCAEIKPPEFVEWIQKNNIIEDIYINNIHSELINRSGELFKFMLNQNLLTEQLANEMFNTIERQDQMTKQGFLKLLAEISSEPKRSQAEFIIQNIKKTEAKELTAEHIDVIYELAQFKQLVNVSTNKTDSKEDSVNQEVILDTTQVNKNTIDALYYFYDLIVSKDFNSMSQELKAKIIDKFCNLTRIEDGKSQRMQFFGKCIDDIKRNVSVNHLLQIIKSIIGTYSTDLQIKNGNSNNSNGTNLLIKLSKTNDNQPNEQGSNTSESKKRSYNQQDNLPKIVEEEEQIESNDQPSKKKTKAEDGVLSQQDHSQTQQKTQLDVAEQLNKDDNNNNQKSNNNSVDLCKSKIVEMLIQEYKLIDTILENIRQVKCNYRKKLENTSIGQNEKKDILKQFRSEIADRIDFIKLINTILEEGKRIITTQFLCAIWKDIVENPLDIDERDLLYKWLRELADEKGSIVHEVATFFKQQLKQNSEFVQHLSFEGFLCYKAMFISLNLQLNYIQQLQIPKSNYTTNAYGAICSLSGGPSNNNNNNNGQNEDQNGEFEYLILTEPQNLEGMDLLWEIIYKNGQERVTENSIDFLVKLHLNITHSSNLNCGDIRKNFITECMNIIQTSLEDDDVKVKRTIDILQCLLNESEKKGIGYLKPLNGLVKGEVQNLVITNDITQVSEGLKKQDIKIESNKTIIDLKMLIASKVNSTWDQIKIKRSTNFKQLRDQDNSRTIGEIRFKSNENLIIERRQTPPIQEANLLNPDGSLVEKAKQIFTEWFKMFSSDGLMDADNLAKFIYSCTGENCKPDDSRVVGTIATWDHDKDHKLDLEDFLNFYKNACTEKKSVVWKNLHSHNYRNDLKKLSEVGEQVEDIDILPRNLILQNPAFYDMVIKILDNDKISENAINLLNRLPASPEIVKKILNLERVKVQNNPDWSMILDTKNSYRLLYNLTIIEYLMEDNESQLPASEEQNQTQPEQKTQQEAKEANTALQNSSNNQKDQQENKKSEQTQNEDILKKIYSQGAAIDPSQWREEFIQCGGFDQLFKVFIQYSQQDYSKLGINNKNIVSFILRIMKNYLTATFANKVPHLYKINQYAVQVKYSLDVINENLRKAEESKEGVEEEEEKKQEEQKNNKENNENSSKPVEGLPQVIPYNPNFIDQNAGQSLAPIVGPHSKISFSFWANRTRVKETTDFLQLKEKLSGKLGQKILDTLDIESMLDKILEILLNVISTDTELESEDRVIIEFCWCIIIDITLYNSQQRERLVKISSDLFSNLIFKGLFNFNLYARRVFSHALYLISRYDKGSFSRYLLDLLMKNVPSSKDTSKSDCNQYYELLCKIIEESRNIENITINFSHLIDDMILNIKNHISQETRYNARNDKMLIGFLNMCEKILKIEPSLGQNLQEFADYLFDVCLFCKDPEGMLDENLNFEEIQKSQVYEFNPEFYVKCKSSDSRKAAYKILICILKSNKQIFSKIIKDGLNVLIDTLATPNGWNYRPSNEQKCHQNYLGIKNLSQICYMNSMLQQFYMTKTFRYALLAADDQIEPNLVEYRGSYYDDNILHQIQKMFAFLDLSDRQDFNPTAFCFSFKDHSGQPVNVCVQQDAQEFLNMIFEKLETSLKQTPFKYILESVYGGQTISKMVCSSCGNVKAKHELFYTQQLRVEGCKKIQDSFEKMIEGETISDFKCDACEKKCDQSRRICFSQLPNVLIIQLQRIIFDFDTFENKKINTKLEFPHNLDLKEYTIEYLDQKEKELKIERVESNNSDQFQKQSQNVNGQENDNIHPDEYYKYRLKGITVHQGTAQLGHYYSYINYKDDKWLEFNDSKIREFNPQNIESECFGGSSSSQPENFWESSDNSKNAYILVYERELKTPLKVAILDEEQKTQVENSLSIKIKEPVDNQSKKSEIAEIDYYSINQRIPARQFISTWIDNHKFMLEKHIYSLEFLQFLKDMILMVEKPKDYIPSLTLQSLIYTNYAEIPEEDQVLYYQTLQMCSKLFFNIFYKSSDFEILKDLLVQMKAILDLIPQYTYEFAKEFIFSRFKQIESVLCSCSESTVRTCYAQIIVFTINNLISYYNLSLETPLAILIQNEDQLTERELCERDILQFLDKLLEIMHTEVSKNWLRMQQYLEIFRDLSYGGESQVQWCFNKELIAVLIDFFLGNASPLNCYGNKKHEIGNKFVTTPFGPLLQCVSLLISKVKSNFTGSKIFTFSNNDLVVLDNWEFYWKSMQENYDSLSICYIGQCMSYKDKGFSYSFGRLILKGINKANSDHIKQYLDLMSSYLAIADEYQQNRVEWIFGYGSLKINPNDSYEMKLNLEEQIVSYDTQLKQDNIQSVLNILYHYRKLQDNLCLNILQRILLLCKNDTQYKFLNYLMKIPGPSYCCAHYLSWVRPHLETIISDNQKTNLSNQKEELAKQCLAIYEEIETVINQYAIQLQKEKEEQLDFEQQEQQENLLQGGQDQNETDTSSQILNENNKENSQYTKDNTNQSTKEKGLKSLWKSYLIGKTVQVEEKMCMPIAQDNNQEEVNLRELDYTVYYCDSHPTGSTNSVFPESVRISNTIHLYSINMDESNIKDFLYIYDPNSNDQNNNNNSSSANKSANKNSPDVLQEDQKGQAQQEDQKQKQSQQGKGTNKSKQDQKQSNNKGQDEDADDEDEEDNIVLSKRDRHRQNLYLNIQTKQINNQNNQNSAEPNPNGDLQLYEMQEIQNNEQVDMDATNSNQEDTSFDSNKAYVGGDFNISQPSATDFSTFKSVNGSINNSKGVNFASDDNKENQNANNDIENQLTSDKLKAEQALINCDGAPVLIPAAAPPAQNAESTSLVFYKHVLNVKQEVGNMIKRFVIDNSTPNIANVSISFTIEQDNQEQQINQSMPYQCSLEVQPQTSQVIYSMRKINPHKDWSKFTISAECQFIQTYNQQQQQQQQQGSQQANKQNEQQQKGNNVDKTDEIAAQDPDKNDKQNDYFGFENYQDAVVIGPQQENKQDKNYSGTKSCPVCTYLQPAINNFCDICESNLN